MMKTWIKNATIVLVLVVACAPAVYAQSQVADAFDAIVGNNRMITGSDVQQSSDSAGVKCSTQVYKFDSNFMSDYELVQRFVNACRDHQDQAYSFILQQDSKSKDHFSIRTANGSSIVVGTKRYKNLLIYNVADPQRDDYRTCYVMEWNEKDGCTANGLIIRSYTKRPGRERPSSKQIYSGVLSDGSSFVIDEDNRVKINGIDILESQRIDPDDLEDLQKLIDQIDPDDLASLQELIDGGSEWRSGRMANDYANDMGLWLANFNTYKSQFAKYAKRGNKTSALAAQSQIANDLLQLCKHQPEDLTPELRKACIESLNDLSAMTSDNVVKAVLSSALSAMKR